MFKCINNLKRKKKITYIRILIKKYNNLLFEIDSLNKELIKTYNNSIFNLKVKITSLQDEVIKLNELISHEKSILNNLKKNK